MGHFEVRSLVSIVIVFQVLGLKTVSHHILSSLRMLLGTPSKSIINYLVLESWLGAVVFGIWS